MIGLIKYELIPVTLLIIVSAARLHSQTVPPSFGEVTIQELSATPFPSEKGAEAIVLHDVTLAKVVYSNGFKTEYNRHIRIKILKTSGYHLANLQIPYGSHDRVSYIRAAVHNLTGGVHERTEVSNKQYFREKIDPYHYVIRFTFPNIREGSIIEYSYTLVYNEIWNFKSIPVQRSIPVRYFDYQFTYPEYFQYIFNYSRDSIITYDQKFEKNYYAGDLVSVNNCRWTAQNIPPFEHEYKMPENEEYILSIDFSLISVDIPGKLTYIESPTYKSLTEELLDRNSVGAQITNTLLFAREVREAIVGSVEMKDKMEAVYNYLIRNIKWNGYEQMWPSRSLAKAAHERTGTSAEINLILINMLRTAGIAADPVVLSTRDNGPVHPSIATAGRLNYLICLARIDGVEYLLDATDRFRPAGMLPYKCLNGQGWVLSKTEGRWINLLNQERYSTIESYELSMENRKFIGHALITFSGYDAVDMRRLIREEGLQGFISDAISKIKTAEIKDIRILNQDSLHLPLQIEFDITLNHLIHEAGDLLYFNPLISMYAGYLNSWLKVKRLYPIDLGCPGSDYLYCRIKIPPDCRLFEIPESIRIIMPDNDAGFTFSIAAQENALTVICDLKIMKVFFPADEYPFFREFYSRINMKCNEMVLLKKL